jgi:hypothetical protein
MGISPLPGQGVFGKTTDPNQAGVSGLNEATKAFGALAGIDEQFNQPAGVFGASDHQGVFGLARTDTATGVYGDSKTGGGIGVRGETNTGVAIQGQSFGTGLAGKFVGGVEIKGLLSVSGDIQLVNEDCAEDFDIGPTCDAAPGTVMVIHEDGALYPSSAAYDKRVAGVVAGAGQYRPGIVLGRREAIRTRLPVALLGKTCCRVDANDSPVMLGDLLTTSSTPGHAMKATDPRKAFGSVIGKALGSLQLGCGVIPILVALQ